jgi:heat shock protein 5
MTMFYICALVFAPMLFMSMIPSAHAQEDVKEASLTGPGKSRTLSNRTR